MALDVVVNAIRIVKRKGKGGIQLLRLHFNLSCHVKNLQTIPNQN